MVERVEVSVSQIQQMLVDIFMGVNVPEKDAKIVAAALVDAERSGVESHGLTRLKAYVDRVKKGTINANPQIKVKENGAVAYVDGNNGLGQVVTSLAVDKAIELAKKYGVGIVSAGNSNHFGTAGYYTNKIADHGCIGFSGTNAGATTAPFGGMDLLLGTNPFSVAFPATEENFCADMATSAVAKGKIRIYAKENKPIPLGWALDENGNDTTDPEAAIKGILLPMSGHKGYALAMVIDALCGLLTGSNLSCEAAPVVNSSSPANIGHFICAIDIEHFLPLKEFTARAQEWFDKMKHSKARPKMKIMIPGEPEAQRRALTKEKLNIIKETVDMINNYYVTYGKKN